MLELFLRIFRYFLPSVTCYCMLFVFFQEQVCPELEELQNGKISYGEGFNGTILELAEVSFMCNSGTE